METGSDCEDCSWRETYTAMGCEIPYEDDSYDSSEPDFDFPVPTPMHRDDGLEPDLLMAVGMDIAAMEPQFGISAW